MEKKLFYPILRVVKRTIGVAQTGARQEPQAETWRPSDPSDAARTLALCSMPEARKLLDQQMAERFKVLPLGLVTLFGRKVLSLATEEKASEELRSALRFATGCEIKLVPVDAGLVNRATFLAYRGDEAKLESSLKTLAAADISAPQMASHELEFRSEATEATAFLGDLIDFAICRGASDIHLVPRRNGAFVQLRIKGKLHARESAICSLEIHKQFVGRIKVLAKMDTTLRDMPQDGSFRIPVGQASIHLRVSSMPTVHGEKIVLRLLGCDAVRTLEDLGVAPELQMLINATISKHSGFVLCSGPTGSGKSSTLYSILSRLSAEGLSVISIEDPVELELPGVAQTSLRDKGGLGYAECLRASLRQDPDVIMLGEIRDPDSARVALQAALSGHLVLSSIHARSAIDVLLRLEFFGIERPLIAQPGSLILSQRLVPRLCEYCKVIDLAPTQRLGVDIYRPVGCNRCDYAGYGDRVLATEGLFIDEQLAQGLSSSKPLIELAQNLKKPLFFGLKESLSSLLRTGQIDAGILHRY